MPWRAPSGVRSCRALGDHVRGERQQDGHGADVVRARRLDRDAHIFLRRRLVRQHPEREKDQVDVAVALEQVREERRVRQEVERIEVEDLDILGPTSPELVGGGE